jgi:hypothetical protein
MLSNKSFELPPMELRNRLVKAKHRAEEVVLVVPETPGRERHPIRIQRIGVNLVLFEEGFLSIDMIEQCHPLPKE